MKEVVTSAILSATSVSTTAVTWMLTSTCLKTNVNPLSFHMLLFSIVLHQVICRHQKDITNDVTPNIKIAQELKLKTMPVIQLQALQLAAAHCNVVRVFTKK